MSAEKKVNICRVCLRTDAREKCMSLFQKYKDSVISDSINAIANVSIKKGDGLPSKICPDCLLELETAVNFKLKCETSNTILLNTNLNESADINKDIDFNLELVKKEEPPDLQDEYSEDYFADTGNIYDVENTVETVKQDKPFISRAIDLKLICHDCGESFKSKCKLRVHWKKVHLPLALICQLCKRAFRSYKAFNRHIKNKRKSCISTSNMRVEGIGKARVFHCLDCKYSSRRIKDIRTHLVIHNGERPFVCNICSKAFSQQSSLQCHAETFHDIIKKEITCQYCGKHIKGRHKVYRHLKRHTEARVQCEICKKTLKSKESLKTHMIRHDGVKSYTCEICASTFFTLSELCNHRRMTHNKNKVWHKCDICEYKSHRTETIRKHKSKHTDSNLPCIVCGMFFETEQKLVLHQRRHFAEKKYVCPHCDRKFFKKDSLSRHIREKHNCTMLINKPVPIKKESPVVNVYDDMPDITDTLSGNSKNKS